jgi:hypothetical protein
VVARPRPVQEGEDVWLLRDLDVFSLLFRGVCIAGLVQRNISDRVIEYFSKKNMVTHRETSICSVDLPLL